MAESEGPSPAARLHDYREQVAALEAELVSVKKERDDCALVAGEALRDYCDKVNELEKRAEMAEEEATVLRARYVREGGFHRDFPWETPGEQSLLDPSAYAVTPGETGFDPPPSDEDREKSRQWATERFGPRDEQKIIKPHEWDEFVELRAVGRAEGRAEVQNELADAKRALAERQYKWREQTERTINAENAKDFAEKELRDFQQNFQQETVRLVRHLEGCLLGVRDVMGRGKSRPLETALRRAK